jgi:hypothetical protein
MKKLIILLTVLLSFTFCKGPGSGPLVRESFNKEDKAQSQNTDGKNHMGQVTTEKVNVVVEPCEGCVTIAKLLENKQSQSLILKLWEKTGCIFRMVQNFRVVLI